MLKKFVKKKCKNNCAFFLAFLFLIILSISQSITSVGVLPSFANNKLHKHAVFLFIYHEYFLPSHRDRVFCGPRFTKLLYNSFEGYMYIIIFIFIIKMSTETCPLRLLKMGSADLSDFVKRI